MNTTLKTFDSPQVKKVTGKLRISTDRLSALWFDAGLDYLEILKTRIRRKRVFDAQFRPMIAKNPAFGKLQPAEVFEQIRKSDAFWQWWATQLWCICSEDEPKTVTELAYLLEFNEQLIPIFTLKKIFYGEQKHHAGEAVVDSPAQEVRNASKKRGRVITRTASRV